MKRFGLGLLATTMLSGTAMAADLPVFVEEQPYVIEEPAPLYNWTGIYIGLQGGYAWDGEGDDDDDGGDFDHTNDVSGFVGGAHVGYMAQFNRFVVGAEADAEFANIDGDDDDDGFFDFDDDDDDFSRFRATREYNFLASARLRAGVTFNRFLVYATGGYAYANADVETRFEARFEDEFFEEDLFEDDDESEGLHGYTVGGGVEALVGTNMSVGLEYRYTNFEDTEIVGRRLVDADDFEDFDAGSMENDFHAVRARFSYHF